MDLKQEEEEVSAEVRELLTNYRNARRTSYKPCHTDNLVQCLSGLHEELGLLNVKYIFNPYTDVCDGALTPAALVALVNAAYSLLHEHKRLSEKADMLTEREHVLESTNAMLNTKIERLQAQLARRERDARSSIAEGLQSAERAIEAREELCTARARIAQLTTRLAATEHALHVSSTRAERDKQQLQDKFRDKCGTFLSTSDARDDITKCVLEREETYKETIRKLDRQNRRLLSEVLALKKDLLTESLAGVQLK